MKLLIAGLIALPTLFASAPAFADVKQDYMAACMKASSNNDELCTCKTEEASKLVDEEMMGYLVLALNDPQKFQTLIKDGKVPEKVTTKWPFYVRDSNKVCLPPTN